AVSVAQPTASASAPTTDDGMSPALPATAIITPSATPVAPPAPSATPPAPPSTITAAVSMSPPQSSPPIRGVTDSEIRFGIAAPFSGSAKELGRQMKLGLDTAFGAVNSGGGIHGRQLKLIGVDDGYEPTRTLDAMKLLTDKDSVFGVVGN